MPQQFTKEETDFIDDLPNDSQRSVFRGLAPNQRGFFVSQNGNGKALFSEYIETAATMKPVWLDPKVKGWLTEIETATKTATQCALSAEAKLAEYLGKIDPSVYSDFEQTIKKLRSAIMQEKMKEMQDLQTTITTEIGVIEEIISQEKELLQTAKTNAAGVSTNAGKLLKDKKKLPTHIVNVLQSKYDDLKNAEGGEDRLKIVKATDDLTKEISIVQEYLDKLTTAAGNIAKTIEKATKLLGGKVPQTMLDILQGKIEAANDVKNGNDTESIKNADSELGKYILVVEEYIKNPPENRPKSREHRTLLSMIHKEFCEIIGIISKSHETIQDDMRKFRDTSLVAQKKSLFSIVEFDSTTKEGIDTQAFYQALAPIFGVKDLPEKEGLEKEALAAICLLASNYTKLLKPLIAKVVGDDPDGLKNSVVTKVAAKLAISDDEIEMEKEALLPLYPTVQEEFKKAVFVN